MRLPEVNAASYQFPSVQALRIAQAFDIARDGLAKETEHLADWE